MYLTRREKRVVFLWIVAAIVLVTGYIIFQTVHFIRDCIFEWPIRWDVRTCWNEQKQASWDKAGEGTSLFIP